MGQAKRRGTRDQRVAIAMKRAEAEQVRRRREAAEHEARERERIAAMTPQQRRRHEAAVRRGRALIEALSMAADAIGFVPPALRRSR